MYKKIFLAIALFFGEGVTSLWAAQIPIYIIDPGSMSNGSTYAPPRPWYITQDEVETGEKMICQNMTESSCSIDTKGWKRGVYVVRVVIGDEVLSEKFIIK